MSLIQRVGRNSFVYAATTFLQRGINFLLLPLYTRFLTPEDYGVLAVVGSLAALLLTLTSLSLTAAVTRFYFAFREQPDVLKEFWGTVLTLGLLVSSLTAVVLLTAGPTLLAPLYGDIPFWPYVALGVGTAALQPTFATFLAILQTKEKVALHSLHSLLQFALTVSLTVSFVVLMGSNAAGPLLAGLITAFVYFFVSLYSLRHEFRMCLKVRHIRSALGYSLPLVPHSMASQVAAASDRIFLNQMVSTASAGLYNVGSLFGGIMSVVVDGVNRAYVPAAMDALESRAPDRLAELTKVGIVFVAAYSLAATALSLFSREVIALMTAAPFHGSYVVVPFIAFSFVSMGIYYLLVNILFFNVGLTRIVAAATIAGAVVNIVLNFILIQAIGFIGAALAALTAQVTVTLFVAVIAKAYEPVRWPYRQFAVVPASCLAVTLAANAIEVDNAFAYAGLKLLVLGSLYCLVSLLLWRDLFFLPRHGLALIKKRA